MSKFPPLPRRAPGTISRAIGDEYVVIEPTTQTAHALEGLAAAVWRAMDDGTRPDAPAETVAEVVVELVALGLAQAPAGFSRRTMLRRTGLVVAGTGVASIALPMSHAAASPDFNFQTGKTTPGPILTRVPANPTGSPRNLRITMQGASGGGAVGAVATGGGGAQFSFVITQPGNGATFDLLGWVGGGGGVGGTTGGAAGVSGGSAPYPGGVGGSSSGRVGGGGGAATYVTTSTGVLIAVAGGGAGAGSNGADANTNGGGGGNGAATVANTASTSNTGATGVQGLDNDAAVLVLRGTPGVGGGSSRDTSNSSTATGGAGGNITSVSANGAGAVAGSAGTASAGGAGGSGTARGGNGGGGGGGYGGGGGGASGAQNTQNAAENGGGSGGGGGANFVATAGTYVGFTIAAGNITTQAPRAVTANNASGASGSIIIVSA